MYVHRAADQEVEDMPLTEAALDAEWKKIQKKTFTRWCNEHLKKQDMLIEDLANDFSDGIKLIVLLELLSGKKVGRYSKRPRVHAQRMENVEMALDFIMKKERIRLVNIGKLECRIASCYLVECSCHVFSTLHSTGFARLMSFTPIEL